MYLSFIHSLIIFIISYVVGSVPFGYLFAKWHGIADIRNHGSGTAGATNVSRLLGFHAFFIVFLLDALRAYVWVYLLQEYAPHDVLSGCIALLLGNGFSIFLQGRSGKGVATSFGILARLHPLLLAIAGILWCSILARTRIVGVASIAVLIGLPILSLHFLHDSSLIFFMGFWGLFLHRDNIREYVRRLRIS